ncbi:hypothetical protein HaLaN_04496, partial [Haematococcus lacustris]
AGGPWRRSRAFTRNCFGLGRLQTRKSFVVAVILIMKSTNPMLGHPELRLVAQLVEQLRAMMLLLQQLELQELEGSLEMDIVHGHEGSLLRDENESYSAPASPLHVCRHWCTLVLARQWPNLCVMAALVRWVLFIVDLTFVPGVQLAHVGDAQLGSLEPPYADHGRLCTVTTTTGLASILPQSPPLDLRTKLVQQGATCLPVGNLTQLLQSS